MPALTSFFRGLANTLRPRSRRPDIDDEMAFHLESRADELSSRGVPRAEAERLARLEFGSRVKYEEEVRDSRGFAFLEHLARDLRYGVRSLLRSPSLVLVSVLSLGIGIGANTTLFSALAPILLSMPTAVQPERLVTVEPGNSNQFSALNFQDLRDANIFEAVFGSRPARLALRLDGQSESVQGLAVTGNFFQGLGVNAAIGRTFIDREVRDGASALAVLSHEFWRRRFQADPAIVGRTVIINAQSFAVIGVLPADYLAIEPMSDPEIYMPLSDVVLPNLQRRENSNALNVVARLAPETGPEQARIAVTRLGQELERLYPNENRDMGQPARVSLLGPSRFAEAPLPAKMIPIALAFLCGLVLVISCANVAGLLLARAARRQPETALRVALGASRARLMQALLAESLILSVAGAALALLLTLWLTRLLWVVELPVVGPVYLRMQVDWWLWLYAALLVVVTTVVCGVMPALTATRQQPSSHAQQAGARGATPRLRLRHALLATEVAASAVLIVMALLFVRTLFRMTTFDTGVDLEHGLVATIEVPPERSREAIVTAARQTIEQLDATAGVVSSSIADIVPLGTDLSRSSFRVDDQSKDGPPTYLNSVGPRYFDTMGIPLLRGREFTWADRAGTPLVVIVNQSFARAYFQNRDPLEGVVRGVRMPPSQVVGVVQDSSQRSAGESPQPALYFAYAQRPVSTQYRPLQLHVRTSGSPASAVRSIRDVVARVDPDAPARVTTLGQATSFEYGLRKAGSLLLGALGAFALFLAMIGLYGVFSYVVAARTSEIGVRMALGAPTRALLWDVLHRGLILTGVGIVVGEAVALGASRLLSALLAGLSPADPIALGGSALALLLMASLASYVPARRATRVNPVVALRAD